jgi:hypothetical protein
VIKSEKLNIAVGINRVNFCCLSLSLAKFIFPTVFLLYSGMNLRR